MDRQGNQSLPRRDAHERAGKSLPTVIQGEKAAHILLLSRSNGHEELLIEGVSGTGKTSICKELQRRGYHAINGDTELAYQGDPETVNRRMAPHTSTTSGMWIE